MAEFELVPHARESIETMNEIRPLERARFESNSNGLDALCVSL